MNELVKRGNELLEIEEKLIIKLDYKTAEIETHHRICNISKSVGTGAGIIGTVAVMTSPFTGGFSIRIAGVVGMVAGALTNIGTTVADYFITDRFMSEVKELVQSHEANAVELKILLENVRAIIDLYGRETGCTEEEAWAGVAKTLSSGGKDIITAITRIKGAINTAKTVKFAKDLIAIKKAGGSIGIQVMTNIPAGASSKTVAAMTRASAQIGTKASMATGKALLQAVGKTIGILANIADLGFTIYGWATDHPTLKTIKKVRIEMSERYSVIEKLVETLKQLEC